MKTPDKGKPAAEVDDHIISDVLAAIAGINNRLDYLEDNMRNVWDSYGHYVDTMIRGQNECERLEERVNREFGVHGIVPLHVRMSALETAHLFCDCAAEVVRGPKLPAPDPMVGADSYSDLIEGPSTTSTAVRHPEAPKKITPSEIQEIHSNARYCAGHVYGPFWKHVADRINRFFGATQ